MNPISSRLDPRSVGLVLGLAALLFSMIMLASLLPSARLPSLVQILYYLLVPGYALLQLVDHPFGSLDRIAWVVAISLGLLVGLTALFQTFYQRGAVNQSLLIPLVAIAASALSIRAILVKKP